MRNARTFARARRRSAPDVPLRAPIWTTLTVLRTTGLSSAHNRDAAPPGEDAAGAGARRRMHHELCEASEFGCVRARRTFAPGAGPGPSFSSATVALVKRINNRISVFLTTPLSTTIFATASVALSLDITSNRLPRHTQGTARLLLACAAEAKRTVRRRNCRPLKKPNTAHQRREADADPSSPKTHTTRLITSSRGARRLKRIRSATALRNCRCAPAFAFRRCRDVRAHAIVRQFKRRDPKAWCLRCLTICTTTNVGECRALLGHDGRNISVTDRRPACAVGGRVSPPRVDACAHAAAHGLQLVLTLRVPSPATSPLALPPRRFVIT